MPKTKIITNEVESLSSGSLSIASSSSSQSKSDNDTANSYKLALDDEKMQSRLSFIVKERLHEFTKDIRRRTSQANF